MSELDEDTFYFQRAIVLAKLSGIRGLVLKDYRNRAFVRRKNKTVPNTEPFKLQTRIPELYFRGRRMERRRYFATGEKLYIAVKTLINHELNHAR